MMSLRLSLLALLLVATTAFIPSLPPRSAPATKVYALEKSFLDQANKCLEKGECNIDDVNDLLVQIRLQVKSLKDQLAEVQKYEEQLTGMSGDAPRTDTVKDIIKAVLRAMDVDPEDDNFPAIIRAAGFSGDKFKGGKDGVPVAQFKKA